MLFCALIAATVNAEDAVRRSLLTQSILAGKVTGSVRRRRSAKVSKEEQAPLCRILQELTNGNKLGAKLSTKMEK